MQIFQNIACFDILFNPSDKTIKFDTLRLQGKKILSVFVAGVPYTGPNYNPPRPHPYLDGNTVKSLAIFLNLIDTDGNQFVTDLSIEDMFLDDKTIQLAELQVNRFIDWEKSYFTYKADTNLTQTAKLRVYVSYQTENFQPFSDEINGSMTFSFKNYEIFVETSLFSIVGWSLKNKKIKKIITDFSAYLNIVGDKNIENLDTNILTDLTPKEIYFDNIDIDVEKSTITSRNSNQTYTYNITFIY
jgi:hypothetical protein